MLIMVLRISLKLGLKTSLSFLRLLLIGARKNLKRTSLLLILLSLAMVLNLMLLIFALRRVSIMMRIIEEILNLMIKPTLHCPAYNAFKLPYLDFVCFQTTPELIFIGHGRFISIQ